MTGKIFRSSFFVGVSVLILSAALFLGVLYQYFGRQLMAHLASEGALAAQAVEVLGRSYLEGLDTESRFTWVAADGTVLFDNAADAQALENHTDRAEIRQAMTNQSGTSVRYSSTLSQRTLYVAQRLSDGSVLRVASTQDTVAMLLWSMAQPILMILALAVFLSLLISARLSRRIIQPILEVDLEHPEHTAYPELAPLLSRIQLQNATIARQMEQLRHKQSEFTAITQNMSEGFLLIDRTGDILSHNAGALALLHAQPLQERSSYLSLNADPVFRQTVGAALAGARCEQLMHSQGRCCQVLANPVLEDDQIHGAVVVILDVTEREQREELRREFTANVSHELRTPLTSISGIAEILKNGLVQPEDIPGFAGDIYSEAQRLIHLVGDIIRLSQLDEGGETLQRQPVELLALSRTVAQRLSVTADAASVTLSVSGQSAYVDGIPAILDEMVYNLCDNAIKYNRPGGSVEICVEQMPRGMQLCVRDTGIGIPADDCQRVFERFFRVDKSHSKAIGGTGLGLSIVKHGAAFHNAQVELSSQLDVGTTVRLFFQKSAEKAEE